MRRIFGICTISAFLLSTALTGIVFGWSGNSGEFSVEEKTKTRVIANRIAKMYDICIDNASVTLNIFNSDEFIITVQKGTSDTNSISTSVNRGGAAYIDVKIDMRENEFNDIYNAFQHTEIWANGDLRCYYPW